MMEMLAVSDSKVADSIIDNIVDNGGRIIVRSRYDALSRPEYKDIIVGANTINTTQYQYKELANGNTTPRIEKESNDSILSGQDTTIEYTYDNAGNITSKITKNESNVIIKSETYQYDLMGRLTYESKPNMPKIHPDILEVGEVTYGYDSNGNIVSEVGLNNNGELSYEVSYTYHSVVKDRLVSRTLLIYNEDQSLIATIPYTYNMDSIYTGNLASIVDDGNTTNLTWSGRRLTGIGGVTYNYDESGLRISKSRTGDTSSFVYAGDRLIKQSRTISSITTNTFFNYDESSLLIGLSINNKEYFYLRDITGNINKIIDINGNVMVNYSYNAWGVVSSGVNSSLSGDLLTQANLLLVHNPYVYKGYFYDSETGYYYLKSRYYDPRIHRFISADKIDYLDPQSLSSLNLYVYCGDNPVMMMDENGTVPQWLGWTLTGLIIAGLIIASIATGGAALAVGGLIGATTGLAASVSSQAIENGWDGINSWQVLLDTGIGAATGMIGGSGVSKGISMIAGGVFGSGGSILGDVIAGNNINFKKAIFMGIIGVGIGAWTGAGAKNAESMVSCINSGKAWGSKAFLISAKEYGLRQNSGLLAQTMYTNMAKAITGYIAMSITKVAIGYAISYSLERLYNKYGW